MKWQQAMAKGRATYTNKRDSDESNVIEERKGHKMPGGRGASESDGNEAIYGKYSVRREREQPSHSFHEM